MAWDAIGAIGEILGALAVVATLAYLAVQVRFAKKVAAETNRLTRGKGVCDAVLVQATNDNLRESMTKTYGLEYWYQQFADEFDVSLEDAGRSDSMHVYWFWLHWAQWSSTNDDKGLAELTNVVRSFYANPAILYSWNHTPMGGRTIMETGFVKFVEDALASDPAN